MNLLLGENVERISAFFKLFWKKKRKEKKPNTYAFNLQCQTKFLIPFCVIRTDYKVLLWSFWTSTHILRLYVKQKVASSSELNLRPDVLFCFIMEISPSTVCFLFSFAKSHVSPTFTKSATRDPIMKLISFFSFFLCSRLCFVFFEHHAS